MFDLGIRPLLILIPALPLAAALLTALFGRRVLGRRSHVPAVLGIGVSFVAAVLLLFQVQGRVAQAEKAAAGQKTVGVEEVVTLWSWAALPETGGDAAKRAFQIDITLRADPLTAVMLVTVTFVALLVAVYSIGYMHGDPGYWRFYSYINLFVFSMTMLVSVSNFMLLYVFWEAVGLCSYLLIGFWFEKPEAAAAGKKAFLVNRVGDFGFALGLFLLWITYNTFDFHDTLVAGKPVVLGILGQTRLASPATMYVGGFTATAIGLLLMLGACGKSAQFPLHVWLPDAMEGPSPVSALIHAATMVTAGVYMVARCYPLFAASPDALQVVAVIGGITALMAAFIALAQNDLKRILAYSTISQLGYMFMGLGVGTLLGATAGMFHLFTHAFFKALLFLGAGSVMHAMGGIIDIRRFGGLRRLLPVTHWTFLCGALALAGAFPFAGFWSKDQILIALRESQAEPLYAALYWVAIGAALLTAFYTFRAYFRTFFGAERIPREAGHHAHESPGTMTVPLVILAIGSLVVGAYFELTGGFAHFLSYAPSLAAALPTGHAAEHANVHHEVMATSIVVSLAGIGLAAVVYLGRAEVSARMADLADLLCLYKLSYGKLFFDQVYQFLFVWPMVVLARILALADRYIVDGLVDLVGYCPKGLGSHLRPLQGGLIPFYAMGMLLGLLALIGVLWF